MNCFEARNQFAAFWRRQMTMDARATLVAHLRECARCDHSFRLFALSAPVVHSAVEPEAGSGAQRSGGLHTVALSARRSGTVARRDTMMKRQRRGVGAALTMAVTAILAIYVATAPRDTFEEALVGNSNPDVETAVTVAPVSLFGQEIAGHDTDTQDPLLQETPASLQNELAS